MEEQFPAHIRKQDENTVTQTVQEHCRAAARISGDALDERCKCSVKSQ